MLGTLGKHTDEAHISYLGTYLIAIDERRITEHSRLLAEIFLNFGALALYL